MQLYLLAQIAVNLLNTLQALPCIRQPPNRMEPRSCSRRAALFLRLLWFMCAAASLHAGLLSHGIPALGTLPSWRTGEDACSGRSRALSCGCGTGLGIANPTLAVHAAGASLHGAGPGGEVLGSHSREGPDITAVHACGSRR